MRQKQLNNSGFNKSIRQDTFKWINTAPTFIYILTRLLLPDVAIVNLCVKYEHPWSKKNAAFASSQANRLTDGQTGQIYPTFFQNVRI